MEHLRRTTERTPNRRRRLWLRALATAVFVAIVGFLVSRYAMPVLPSLDDMDFSTEAFAQFMRDAGAWGVAGSIGLMVVHSFIPFPAEFVALANGMVYGPVWGAVITWVGAMLGAFVAFGLARWLGRPFVEAAVPARHRLRLDKWSARSGWQAVFLSRFLPVISFNLVNYAAGLTTVSPATFALATGLGILPVTVVMVVLGHNMTAMSWQSWIALAVSGPLAWGTLHWGVRRRARRQRKEGE